MTKDEFFNKISDNLPIERESDDFIKDINKVYHDYITDISNLDADAFSDENCKTTVIQKTKKHVSVINEALKQYFGGCHGEAFSTIKTHLLNRDDTIGLKQIGIGKTKETNMFFFRARMNDGTIKTCDDMFHIPNTQREIIKTQRFSVPGYPCLYLGNTVYDCWEEMGRPSFDEMFFSGYYVVKEFKVYDLRKPKIEDFEKDIIVETLERLVFVIACQFKVKYVDAPFKPEYIIPQLLLELVVASNREKKKREKSPYALTWGIIYTSTHLSKDFMYQEEYLENLVLPVVQSSTAIQYCGYLASLFNVSAPICFRYEELKERQTGLSWKPMVMDEKEKIKNEYDLTKLGFIERRLRENTVYTQLAYVIIDGPDGVSLIDENGVKTNREIELEVEFNPNSCY